MFRLHGKYLRYCWFMLALMATQYFACPRVITAAVPSADPAPNSRVLVYGSSLLKTMLALNLADNIKFFSNTWLQDKDFNAQDTAILYRQKFARDFTVIPLNINLEFLLGYRVDLVVGSWHNGGFGNYFWMLPQHLAGFNIDSYISSKNSCGRFRNRFWCNLFLLGEKFNVPERAAALINHYQAREAAIGQQDATLPTAVLFRGKSNKNNSFIGGINNFMVNTLRHYGWHMIHPDKKSGRDWVLVQDEFIFQQNPELIIVVGDDYESLVRDLQYSPFLRLLPAVQSQRIVWLRHDEAAASPDYIEGLNKIYRAIKLIQKVDEK